MARRSAHLDAKSLLLLEAGPALVPLSHRQDDEWIFRESSRAVVTDDELGHRRWGLAVSEAGSAANGERLGEGRIDEAPDQHDRIPKEGIDYGP